MATTLTPTEALSIVRSAMGVLLPAITAERVARHEHGAASPEHLQAVEALATAKLRAEDAMRHADIREARQ